MSRTATTYEDPEYWKLNQPEQKHFIMPLQWALHFNLNKESRVLDLGCGLGWHVYGFRHCGIQCDGVELSKYALEHANDAVKKYIKEGSILNIPCEDGSYDVVLALDVLEHLDTKDDVQKAIQELHRVTKRFVIFCIPFLHENADLFRDNTHRIFQMREWWVHRISKCFKIVQTPQSFMYWPMFIIGEKR